VSEPLKKFRKNLSPAIDICWCQCKL
jgi:hypothetical protein